MKNQTLYASEAREQIKQGVDLVANAVKVTLGAKGRNVMCIRDSMLPVVTKDGVSIAQEVQSSNPIVNAGALLVKQVASNANAEAGDGSSSSVVLAQAIVSNAHKQLDAGANSISLKRGIDLATEEVVKSLKRLSTRSSNISTLKNIARISANGDKEISDLVVQAITKVGKDGSIKVEEVEQVQSSVDIIKGYEFDSPLSSWGYITNKEKLQAEFSDVNVLLYEGYLENFSQLDATVQAVTDTSTQPYTFKGLLVIADQVSSEVEKQILEYKRGGLKFMYIKSPSFGTRRTEVMEDIATLIGAKVYRQDAGDNLNNVVIEDLGFIEKVVSNVSKTVLMGGKGVKENIQDRIKVVHSQSKSVQGKKEKDFVKERISKLSSGVAIINVGGYSEVERREKSDRVEDALNAVKACLQEGYVAGGGATFLQISEGLKNHDFECKNEDEQKGVEVLLESISAPFRQICKNAGLESESFEKIIRGDVYGFGVNIQTEKYVNLLQEGIIDPTKVSRLALQNASSISSTFLTTECIVYNNEAIIK